ncbi:MAG: LacI family DNA-binding transcriptional regulator [Filimonas sp.]|nr:LacI family DNA-binding transcriptional regulator [Filimonas sp.]
MRKVTIHDIAKKLELTAATVSRALNNHPAISAATKKRVLDMAKKLNYTPNNLAASLRIGKTNMIGVIIPSAELHFFGSVLHGIEKVANEHKHNIIICQTNEKTADEIKSIEALLHSRVDCILASLAKETTDTSHFAELKKKNTPLILFDRISTQLEVPTVSVDDYKGAFMAVEHLIKQGCKRIAHIAGTENVLAFSERIRGYKDALKKHKLPVSKELILYGDMTLESGAAITSQLLKLPTPPDGIFAVEDFSALGAIKTLQQKKIRVPEDVAVIGFANESFGQYVTPSISTVDQQAIKMGETAAQLYFNSLLKKNFQISHIILEPMLLIRESSDKA